MSNAVTSLIVLFVVSTSAIVLAPNMVIVQSSSCGTVCTVPAVGPNIEVGGESSPDRQRVETTIAVDPHNPSVVVAGSQDLDLKAAGGHRWHGLYRSDDAGRTWNSSLLPGFPGDTSTAGRSSPLRQWNATTDPGLAFDGDGNLYYSGGALTISGSAVTTSSPTLFVAKYTNDGSTYAGVTIVAGSSDKQSIAVDTTGGQYSDSVYIVMDNSVGGTVVFTHSSDGGGTFASPVPVGGRHGALAVAPDGTVYIVTWDNGNLLHISKVHPGGTILTTNIASIPIIPIPSPLPGGSFRTGNNPQIASDSYGIYVTWAEYGSGTSEVEFTKSTDGGISWTRPTRVSDGSSGEHFFPAIASFNGVIGIVWYDSRLNTKSSLNSLDVYYAQSIDGGVSFSPNIRVTNISFDPEQVLRGDAPSNNNPFIGDYIGISAGSSGIFPVWADNRNACDNIDPTFGCVDQDAFTAVVLQSAVPSSPDPCLFCILLPLPTLLWLIIIGAVSAGLGYIAGSRRSGRKGPISRRFRQNRIPR